MPELKKTGLPPSPYTGTMSTPNVVELAKSINVIAGNGTADVSEVDRQQLLQACSKLQSAFESPFEFTLRVIFSVLEPSCKLLLGWDVLQGGR